MRTIIAFIILVTSAAAVFAQDADKKNVKSELAFLEGTWIGKGEGLNGNSTVTQTFTFVLNDNFVQMQTRSVFEPQEKNPKSEIHEDICYLSYDGARQKLVMRGFYIEGFVNTYVQDDSSSSEDVIVFLTESVENAPPGTKAQWILRHLSDNELEEQFFVAFPGQDLSCFSTNRLKRE